MDRNKKRYLRSILFRHLDGIALCGTISALNSQGITTFIQNNPTFSIKDIISKFECNAGYINISLRLLSSQGWLEQNIIEDGDNIEYTQTKKGHTIKYQHIQIKYGRYYRISIGESRESGIAWGRGNKTIGNS